MIIIFFSIKIQLSTDLPTKMDANIKEKVTLETLLSGTVNTTFDGVPFFSTAHPNGPLSGGVTTQANVSTSQLSRTAFIAARLAMRSFADENYQPFGIEPDTLMVGSLNEDVANQICVADLRIQSVP